jgi:hypothetical protein
MQIADTMHAAVQVVPSAAFGFEHIPVLVSQVPATWHASSGVQTTGFPPRQLPPWQVSVWVQELPSSHMVPSAAAGFEHIPVVVSQVPTPWHWSSAMQTTGLLPMQLPPRQMSDWVQALPSVHVVPSAAAGFEHIPVVVLQIPATWHGSSAMHITGFEPTHVPPWQVSVWVHALPSLHAVPFG